MRMSGRERHDTRTATLEQGQALFHVRHDPSAPFELQAGDVANADVGPRAQRDRPGDQRDRRRHAAHQPPAAPARIVTR
jgi:hypothetical protein